jgi:acetolactate decarboxylase
MKKLFFILPLLAAVLTSCNVNKSAVKAGDGELFQYSVISALQAGFYDGELTVGELKTKGDFGIGTFNTLDGEMVVLDGKFYQAKADGKIYVAADSVRTPFACVTFFNASDTIPGTLSFDNFETLEAAGDSLGSSGNVIKAFLMKGHFDSIKVRSVPAQIKPYKPLIDIIAHQSEYIYKDIEGYLVGFSMPEFMSGVNVSGYHLHFVDKSGTVGGHLLSFSGFRGNLQMECINNYHLELPVSKEFSSMNLKRDKEEIIKIEK